MIPSLDIIWLCGGDLSSSCLTTSSPPFSSTSSRSSSSSFRRSPGRRWPWVFLQCSIWRCSWWQSPVASLQLTTRPFSVRNEVLPRLSTVMFSRYLLRDGDGPHHRRHHPRRDRAQDPPPGKARHPCPALPPQARPVDGCPHILQVSTGGKTALKSNEWRICVSSNTDTDN